MKAQATPAPVVDQATIAAVASQLKRAERDEAIKAHGFALEPYKARYIGATVRRLGDEVQRLLTDLSENEPVPKPSDEEVVVAGAIVAVGRGDRKPDPIYYETVSEEEAGLPTIQDALRFRAAEAPLARERRTLDEAESDVAKKTRDVAAANRARDFAAGVRDEAVARVQREETRFAAFIGDQDEAALRAVLASFKKTRAAGDGGNYALVGRPVPGGIVMERVEAAS